MVPYSADQQVQHPQKADHDCGWIEFDGKQEQSQYSHTVL